MMDLLTDFALGLSASLPLSVAAKATVISSFSLLLVRLMQNTRAARRFVILAWTFVVLAILPAAARFAPPAAVVVRESHVRVMATQSSEGPTKTQDDQPLSPTSPASGAVHPASSIPRVPLWIAVWAVGALVTLIPVAGALRQLRQLRSSSRNQTGHDVLCSVELRMHEQLRAPITFGWLRPVILLPADSHTWSIADVRRVVAHEMEHVRRHDWPLHVMARIVSSVYWFHPLVWIAWRQLQLEADRACDDAVVDGKEPHLFAEQLVAMAGRLSNGPSQALSIAGGNLAARVNALLNPNQIRGRSGIRYGVVTAVAACFLGGSAASIQAVHRVTTVMRPEPGAPPARPVPKTSAAPTPSAGRTKQSPVSRQSQAAPSLDRFETSSVTLNTSGETRGGIPGPGGNSFLGVNVSFEDLVRWAYGINSRSYPRQWASPNRWAGLELQNVPQVLLNARFEVRGKAAAQVPEPPSGSLGAFHAMVQHLLTQRFNVVARWEQRERTRYLMTLETPERLPLELLGILQGCLIPLNVPAPKTLPQPICSVPTQSGGFSGSAVAMADIANSLSNLLESEVVDRSGQTARFHVVINFGTKADPPQVREALRRQFGLRLTPETVAQRVLVVERAEMPAVN